MGEKGSGYARLRLSLVLKLALLDNYTNDPCLAIIIPELKVTAVFVHSITQNIMYILAYVIHTYVCT